VQPADPAVPSVTNITSASTVKVLARRCWLRAGNQISGVRLLLIHEQTQPADLDNWHSRLSPPEMTLFVDTHTGPRPEFPSYRRSPAR